MSHRAGMLNGLPWSTDIEGFDEHLLASFSVLRSLTAAMNEASEDETEIDRSVVDAATIWIRSRLSASVLIEREVEEQHMYSLCCLGIQIYLTTITTHCVKLQLDQSDLISKLKSCLSYVDIKTMISPLVLWTIFFGGVASQNFEDQTLFVVVLRQLYQALNISDWDSLKFTLRSLSWLENKHNEQGRLLWNITITNDPFAF